MLAYILSASGWLALVLTLATTVLPYLLQPTALNRALGLGFPSGPLALRMRPHVIIGALILALGLIHASAAMALPSGVLVRLDQTGLMLATAALGLIVLQAVFGVQLLQRRLGAQRAPLRRWHLWSMAALLAATLAHVALNSALLHAALGL